MTDKDRIRLAEAMGWTDVFEVTENEVMLSPSDRYKLMGTAPDEDEPVCSFVPDPFTDANDDYAVLEWIRTRVNDPREDIKRSMMRNMVTNTIKPIKYQVGDYARAALKVLDDD